MNKKKYFISGIGTGIGKTLTSALICEYLKADYFKPVQTGYPPDRDSTWIKETVSYTIKIHPEKYLLKLPASPHLAAKQENIKINIENIQLPPTDNHLIIEGAGGLLVPLNHTHYIADMINKLQAECILVISDYLGCINHSLLSLFYIQEKNIPFKGVIFNGNFDEEIKTAITKHLLPHQIISHIPRLEKINKKNFQSLLQIFTENLNAVL